MSDIFAELEKQLLDTPDLAPQEEIQIAQPAEMTKATGKNSVPVPEFIREMNEIYRAAGSHVFVLHGNINDHPDNTGVPSNLQLLMSTVYDSFWLEDKMEQEATKTGKTSKQTINMFRPNVTAFYTMNDGLVFAHEKGYKMCDSIMAKAEKGKDQLNPGTELEAVLKTLNNWFDASRRAHQKNQSILEQHGGLEKMQANKQMHLLTPEVRFTVVFFNAEKLFPSGSVSQLAYSDRSPIAYIENWAKDLSISSRNRIVLVSRHLDDLNETIRGGDSRITALRIKRPALEDRLEWLQNFSKNIKLNPPRISGKPVTEINWASGFGLKEMAIQCAGVPRTMMETAIMHHWVMAKPLDIQTVLDFKRQSIESEYSGLVEFEEPTYGFDQVGTHDHLKQYFRNKVIEPLKQGSNRCSKGVLLVGPPGTGKTILARALAYESKMNFLIGYLDRLFDGVVGGTEQKTRKFLEAVESAAPLILFLDEIDSVLSSGRQSPGDSGTSARVFNALMTWLSDESRRGKIVVLGASNRPDLLDAALIRQGRFDAILPCLPPGPGDAKGRLGILKAICKKTGVQFEKSLQETFNNTSSGLGRLLKDDKIWTGAEIEVVVNESADNAAANNRKLIDLSDWDDAMDNIIANTREVEAQIDLALWFTNNLKYCPAEWRERAKNKENLQVSGRLKAMAGWGDYDRD